MEQHCKHRRQAFRICADLYSISLNYVNKYALISTRWEKEQAIYCTVEEDGIWNLIRNGSFTKREESLSRPPFRWARNSNFT